MAILNEETFTKGEVVIENLFFDSSNMIKTSYNFTTQQLVVTFHKGGVYTYSEVTEDEYKGLKLAESSTSYLNKTIKPGHPVVVVAKKIDESLLKKLIEKRDSFK